MHASVGDRIHVNGAHVDDHQRDGEIIEVRGKDGSPPYVVHWFALPLNNINFFGWPLGFYMGAQGALIIYVLIIWYYAKRMNELDKEYGVHEGEE